jgi:hypothetical protein
MINNDGAGFTITKKRNHKRFIKLQSGARKRFKNKPPNLIYYSDSELISEIEIGNANRDSEAVGTKTGTFKINFVNVIIEILIY